MRIGIFFQDYREVYVLSKYIQENIVNPAMSMRRQKIYWQKTDRNDPKKGCLFPIFTCLFVKGIKKHTIFLNFSYVSFVPHQFSTEGM